jgi:hypothetical protein
MYTDFVPRRPAPRQIASIRPRFDPRHIHYRARKKACPTRVSCGVLQGFVEDCQPWTGERIPVPHRLRWSLWTFVPVQLFWVICLATIVTGSTSCGGLICTVATLDHHAAALLACGVFSVAGLAGLTPLTRGFSKCNGREVVGLAITSAAGGASLLGLGALIIGALVGLSVLPTFVLAFTATPRREIEDARPRTPFPIAPVTGGN